MKGIEKITQRINDQAQAEIDSILAAAQAQADLITQQGKAKAEAESAEMAARNGMAAEARQERLIGAAQMEAKKLVLAARQELMEKAYDKALEKLCTMSDEAYIAVVVDLLEQAAPDGKGNVVFGADVKQRIGEAAVAQANKKLNGSLTLAEETRPMKGGFILSRGNVEVNCTFETLVRLQKAETAGEVLKKLFP